MPYQSSTRLPGETASKLGHLQVIKSEWVRSLISDFESAVQSDLDLSNTTWHEFTNKSVEPLKSVWATDGSFALLETGRPPKQVSFVKTALLTIDRSC